MLNSTIMIPEYLIEQLTHYSSEFFIYPGDFFELRLQEEMIRSDRSGSPFYYVELDFSNWPKAWPEPVDARRFSSLFFHSLANTARGSDFKGYLENERGIGLVFLDSGIEGWTVFLKRLEVYVQQEAPDLMEALAIWESLLVHFEYPHCVRQDHQGSRS